MHASRNDIPLAFEAGAAYSRDARWGELNVAFEGFPAGSDTRPLFKGLPDDRCQCPHWGYVIKGSFTYRYADREEVIEAGEAFYTPPGHVPIRHEPGTQIVQFSPTADRNASVSATEEVLERYSAEGYRFITIPDLVAAG